MTEEIKSSPYRRHQDIEAGFNRSNDDDDPFYITSTKHAPINRLRRWRQEALVLNPYRRFRYTLDLNKDEEKKQKLIEIRAHRTEINRLAYCFKEVEQQLNGTASFSNASFSNGPIPNGEFSIGQEQLSSMTRDHNITVLQQYGGVKGLSDLLQTNLDRGINGDDSDLLKRRDAFGSNTYPQKKGRSFWMFLREAWRGLTLIILMVAAVASLALGITTEGIKEGWYDGGSIAFAVIVVIVVTAISDYRQSLLFQNLNDDKRNIHLEVIRGGRRVEVSIYDLVVGDVVPLNIGDQVPADGVVISGHSLSIDESSMTVHKDSKNPFLMSGCKVADGSGTMLVTGVGVNTKWGLHMANISGDTGEETPLQVRLNGVATFIGRVGLAVAFIVLVVLLARFFTGHTKNPDGSVLFTPGKTKVGGAVDGAIKILTVAVTIVVVAVPEGLPLVVTLTLAYSMRKMMADKALVRRLSACETMGSATTICCNKTGTLTSNQMTVVEAYAGEEKIDPSDSNSQLSPMLSSLLIEGIAQNSNGSVYVPAGGRDVELSGSPTEKAILNWGIQLGMNFEAARSESSIIRILPFNSEKKRGGVAVKLPNSDVHIHWKGAAEIVLASCTNYIDTNNQLVAMDEDKATYFKNAIDDMATRSLRCVAIAYRSYMEKVLDNEEELSQWVLPDNDLVLLAIVGIKDPCRPGVKDAVRMCEIAGVKVRMVTRDNIQTARAVALECGILTSEADASESIIIEGKEFRELPDPEREEIAEKISVMGGSSPNDKHLLVQALRKRGHVVAVTGDNDAPALHEADIIRLAMGIQGTKVAKESSDIIILDDSLASVVKVVRWGRSIYANIQKFIQFQLTVNVAALVINFVATVSSGDVPLNVVQLLWVNLIMYTLGALALATEPPTDHQMQRPPVGRREPLITNITWGDRLMQAIYHLSVLLVLNFNVVAFVIYFVTKVSSGHVPQKTVPLLWVTLIFDCLGSLTMAIEPQTDHQLHRLPVGRREPLMQSCMYSREPLITNIMWRNLLIQAIYQSGVLLVLNFYGKSLLNLEHDTIDHTNKVKNTLIFNSFVICQIFNEFNARKPDERNIFAGITKNRLFMGIVLLTVVLQILIIEFLGKFASTFRLNWKQWIISFVIGFIGWPLAFLGKFIPVPATPLSSIFKSNMRS